MCNGTAKAKTCDTSGLDFVTEQVRTISTIAAPASNFIDNVFPINGDDLAVHCPVCSGWMEQPSKRHFVCAPCRQSIRTFEVTKHQFLIRRPSRIGLRSIVMSQTPLVGGQDHE